MLFLFLVTQPAFAWWGHSHDVIAAIAKTFLSSSEIRKIEKIINYGTLESQTIVSCATWQDDLKDKGKFYAMGNWHFIDTPILFNKSGPVQIQADTYNVTSYLNDGYTTLLDSSTKDLWAFAFHLRSFIHFVGDIHTPHHTCQMYNDDLKTGDLGGNKYYLNCQYGSACNNIHFFWDSAGLFYPVFDPLISYYKDKFEDNVSAIMDKLPQSYFEDNGYNLKDFQPSKWAAESNEIANTIGYATPINKRPSDEYFELVQKTAQERIALAGYRLGNLLKKLINDIDVDINDADDVEVSDDSRVREIVVWVFDAIFLVGTLVFTFLIYRNQNNQAYGNLK